MVYVSAWLWRGGSNKIDQLLNCCAVNLCTYVCMCTGVGFCMCMCACVRACVCACVRACVTVSVCGVCGVCVCVCALDMKLAHYCRL